MKLSAQYFLKSMQTYSVFTVSCAALFFSANSFSLNHEALQGPFFNLEDSKSYRDPYRGLQKNGSDFEAKILNLIESSKESLDIAVQEIRLPLIAKALVKQHQAGVKVRIILENTYNYMISELSQHAVIFDEGYSGERISEYFRFVDMNGDGHLSEYEISQRDAVAILRKAQVPIIDDTADGSRGSSLMHHKFLISDQKTLLVTSANFTMSDTHGDYSSITSRGNANALMIFKEDALVKAFANEFNTLWGGNSVSTSQNTPRFGIHKPYRGVQNFELSDSTKLKLQFSPTSARLGYAASTNGLIESSIQQAQRSVDMALFVFSEQRLSDSLNKARQKHPLRIRALVEPKFAYQWYSELLDLLGLRLFGHNCNQQPTNSPWKQPIQSAGAPRLPHGDMLHHKFAVIDSRYTIFGSHNWSNSANVNNDENLLVIDNPQVAQRFEEEFERLYGSARLGETPSLREKINEREQFCANRP